MRSNMQRVSMWIAIAGLVAVMLFSLGPYFYLVSSSLKPPEEIFTITPSWIPKHPTLNGYRWAMGPTGANIWVYLRNSFGAAAGAVLLTAFFAVTGGYALARHRFPGYGAVVTLLMLAQLLQGPVILVAWYRLAAQLSLLNTILVLVLAYSTMAVPVAVWLMSGFFHAIPRELEEAALVDGCNPWQMLLRVVLPLATPGLIAVSVFSFITAWNDYQYALILTSSDRAKTVQVAMAELLTFFGQTNWGGMMASGVLASIPIVVIFGFMQRQLVQGLTSGAIKG